MAKPCNWYTVYSAKTDEIIASGTADMIVQQMGYASRNSFFRLSATPSTKKTTPGGVTSTMWSRLRGRTSKKRKVQYESCH